MSTRTFIAYVATAALLVAQQPNAPGHRMMINGIDGPAFPILVNVPTSTIAVFTFNGFPYQPYAIYQGTLQPGAATVFGGFVDLAVNPLPVLTVDGFHNPAYRVGAAGSATLNVTVPPAGLPPLGVPVGFQTAVQAVMGDPLNSPWGYALTAATLCTITQGSLGSTLYSLGNESSVVINLPMWIPFYGTNYSQLFVCSNGYVTFGTNITPDYTPTDVEMNTGPPRIAGMWTDLFCPPGAVAATVNPNPGPGLPGFVQIDFVNVVDNAQVVTHTFSMKMQADGYVEIVHPVTNNPSLYDTVVGMGPGGNLGQPQTQKNFVGAQPVGSTVGPGIFTTPPYAAVGAVNTSFFEWFGSIVQNPYYGNPYNNPFDLFGVTIHAQPAASGPLPGTTLAYFIY